MKFRDDIDIENTWVTSDSHFGHENIGDYCHRPLDYDQVMVAEWRKAVPDDATVIHLGDLCYRGNAWFKNIIAPELTGARKLLLKGNHDHQRYNFYKQCGFNMVRDFKIPYEADFKQFLTGPCHMCQGGTIKGGYCVDCADSGELISKMPPVEYQISFSHYPASDPLEYDEIRLHGHIHNNGYTRDGFVPFLRQHINLSVEQTKYRPVNLKLLLDAYILGEYPKTTEEQLEDARQRKEQNLKGKQ